MSKVNGTVTTDGNTTITQFTGTATHNTQTFYFNDTQDSMIFSTDGHSELTLKVDGRSYTVRPNVPVEIYEDFSSFNITRKDKGSQSFQLTSYVYADDNDAIVVASVEDVLTSTNPKNALSANQGKVLKGLVDTNTANVTTNTNNIGTLSNLQTTDKTSLVNGVNENTTRLTDISIQLTKYCTLDGVADDSTGLELAYADAKAQNRILYLPPNKTLRVTRAVSLHNINLDFKGTVKVDFNGTGITIGGLKVKQYIRQANSTNSAWVTLRVVGGYQSHFEISECTYLQIWADSNLDSDYGGTIPYARFTAYSTFVFEAIPTFEMNCNKTPSNGSILQWINENRFKGGAFKNFTIDGTFDHDNNVFDCPTFENANVQIKKGQSNHFRDCRFEGITNTITFSANTRFNVFDKLYSDTASSVFEVNLKITVTDNGYGNTVTRVHWKDYEFGKIFQVSSRNKIFNNSVDELGYLDGIQAGLHKLKIPFNFRGIYKSSSIPLPDYGNLGVSLDSDSVSWYLNIQLFDSNMNLIKTLPSGDNYVISTSMYFDSANGRYRAGSKVKSLDAIIKNPDGRLKYIQLSLESGESVSGTSFERLGLSLQFLKHNRNLYSYSDRKSNSPIVDAVITSGFGRKGELVPKSTNGYYQCTFSLDTTISADAVSSATQVTVSSATGVANGDIIGILLDDLSTHWTTVSSVSTNTITLGATLPSNVTTGKRTVFNRWV